MQEKRRRQDEITTIVQSVGGGNYNRKGYRKKSNLVTIPTSICKLASINQGDLLSWKITSSNSNVLDVKIIRVPEQHHEGVSE
jgi:hypothetical protein